MKTAVVILNWNTKGYLRSFLPALLGSVEGLDAGVVVADNASTDGSAAMLEREFPSVRLLRLDENYGFTGGYDRAVDMLRSLPDTPDYIVLLNSDVEVDSGWLQPLVHYMDAHPDCGVCGPKLLGLAARGDGSYEKLGRFEYAGAAGGLLDRYGFPYCRGRVMDRTEDDYGQYDSIREVMWISGACMMTRTSLWERLGGLDRRFFAHMEEIDYCWRAQLEGFKVCIVPESRVYHLGGGTLSRRSPVKLRLNYRNSLLMLLGNLPPTVGRAKARRRIAVRRGADWLAAAVYLLSGQTRSFRAVRQAHREVAQLRLADSGTPPPRHGGATVTGYEEISIIFRYFIHGKNIFKYLRNYENRH